VSIGADGGVAAGATVGGVTTGSVWMGGRGGAVTGVIRGIVGSAGGGRVI